MSCNRKRLQIYDKGTEFILRAKDPQGNTITNLGQALELAVIFGRPDGTSFERTAEAAPSSDTPPIDLIRYTTTGGEIDQSGLWKIQGRAVFATGDFRSSIALFDVERNVSGASLLCPDPLDIVLEVPAVSVS